MTLEHAIEIYALVEFRDSVPNGDPDTNQPRQDPETCHGVMTSGCLKSRIRKSLKELYAEKLFCTYGPTLNSKIKGSIEEKQNNETNEEYMCRTYFDIRTFGAVLSTGDHPLSSITGPVQFEHAWSVTPIDPKDMTITRCVVTSDKDREKKDREMGTKWIVPYSLYEVRISISPKEAKVTGFSDNDLVKFLDALQRMCDFDISDARPYSAIRYLRVFTHKNSRFRTRAKDGRPLFELISVTPTEDRPQKYSDFNVEFDADKLPDEVTSNHALMYTEPSELLGFDINKQ